MSLYYKDRRRTKLKAFFYIHIYFFFLEYLNVLTCKYINHRLFYMGGGFIPYGDTKQCVRVICKKYSILNRNMNKTHNKHVVKILYERFLFTLNVTHNSWKHFCRLYLKATFSMCFFLLKNHY